MPIMQERNSEAQLLGSVDHLFAEDRNYCAEWYDAGGTGFIGATTVPFASTRHNFFTEVYSMSAGVLTVLQPGFYIFNWSVYASKVGVTEGSIYSFLEQDPATAVFTELPASRAEVTTFSPPAFLTNQVIIRAQENYRYRVRAASYGIQFTTVVNMSRLSAIRLFKS